MNQTIYPIGIQNFEKIRKDGDTHKLASSLELTYDETRSLLRKRYDGYHFVANVPGIYNPFSLLNTFKYMRPEDYWFETGTPSYLVEFSSTPITTSMSWQIPRPMPMC